jgi:protein-tyrosine kinase
MRLQSTARSVRPSRRAGDARPVLSTEARDVPSAVDERLVVLLDPESAEAERARDIRAAILARVGGEGERKQLSVAFVAPDDGGRLAEVAANVAVSLVQLGRDVLMVDADLRTPAQHALFCLPQSPGLSELLEGQADATQVVHRTAVNRLQLIPAGQGSGSARDAVERRPLLERLRMERLDRGDLLVVSIGGHTVQALTTVLAGFDCVVPVVRRGRTRMRELKALCTELEARGVEICKVVTSP